MTAPRGGAGYGLPAPGVRSSGAAVTPIVGPLASMRAWIQNIAADQWFTPGQPVAPQAPAGTQIRGFDYPVGLNIQYIPRSEEDITFLQLRSFADLEYLTRMAIETRKDQVANVGWMVRPERKPSEPIADYKKRAANDTQVDKIEELFKRPDGVHEWDQWIRIILEEVLVIDALTIWPDESGGRPVLDVVDGSTIKRLIDAKGRTPEPPDVAYQQIIKGVPALNFSSDRMIYRPRNPRAHKLYGYPPVEQIVFIITLALKRAMWKISYYTEGNLPEALIALPSEWPLEQVKTYSEWFNSMLSGQIDVRRRAFFVPQGAGPNNVIFPKQDALKDEMDEWLARVVCYCFSLPPTPFVAQNNRATAATAQEAAKAEGLRPLLRWVGGMLTGIIQQQLGFKGYEWAWDEEMESDPLKRAQIQALQVRNGIKAPNEIREENGDDPVQGGDLPGFAIGTGFAPIGGSAPTEDIAAQGAGAQPEKGVGVAPGEEEQQQAPQQEPGGGAGETAASLSKAGDPSAFRSRAAQQRRARMERLMTTFLKQQGERVAERLAQHYKAQLRAEKYSEDQLRDDHGRFAGEGGGAPAGEGKPQEPKWYKPRPAPPKFKRGDKVRWQGRNAVVRGTQGKGNIVIQREDQKGPMSGIVVVSAYDLKPKR